MCICHTHTHARSYTHTMQQQISIGEKGKEEERRKGCRSKCTVEPRYKEIWHSYNEQHVLSPINYPCLALLIVTDKQNKSILNKLQSCE